MQHGQVTKNEKILKPLSNDQNTVGSQSRQTQLEFTCSKYTVETPEEYIISV